MWVIYNKHTGMERERLPLARLDFDGIDAVLDGLNEAEDLDTYYARWEA